MSKCSVCGRKIASKTSHFGLGCLKKMCELVEMENVKNLKGETLLNDEIARLTNKRKLKKNEKIFLTNRYLTMKFLEKVKINSYDEIREKVATDIKNVGKTKNYISEELITLKQAYEIFKLYSKYMYIKQKAEKIDSEYIQNYLFQNLTFAFSIYYYQKGYLGGVLQQAQYLFWQLIVDSFASKYPLGTDFIKHALQKEPEDRIITEGDIIEAINKDSKFIEKIDEIIKNNADKQYFEVEDKLNYNDVDLFLALNNTTLKVVGIKKEEIWNLQITITDRYDFTDFKEIDEYINGDFIQGVIGSIANNAAMISVASRGIS